jgi:hypothetical protein
LTAHSTKTLLPKHFRLPPGVSECGVKHPGIAVNTAKPGGRAHAPPQKVCPVIPPAQAERPRRLRLHRPAHRPASFGLPWRWDSPESCAEHARLVAEAAVGPPAPADGLTVNELLLVFLRHAEQHYRRADGTNTDELAYALTIDTDCVILRLTYRMLGHLAPIRLPVRMVTTRCHRGGRRWWFLCPLPKASGVWCVRRVPKLHVRDGHFGCRHCPRRLTRWG